MQIDVVTIFPEMFAPILGTSILKRAQDRGLLTITVHNLRDYTHDKRRTVDDRPYGGGPGMLMRPEPIAEAVATITRPCRRHRRGDAGRCQTVLMSPQGVPLSSSLARDLSSVKHLVVVCGHYEGVDERVRQALVHREISIGDYVLTGGELPAMVLIDALARFVPGVIGHAQATREESFASGWLEYPQYTRPAVFRRMAVPAVLRSGDHGRIARWRKLRSVERTIRVRPDLVVGGAGDTTSEPRRPAARRHQGQARDRRGHAGARSTRSSEGSAKR